MKPNELTKESLIPILLDPNNRQRLLEAISAEHGTYLPITNRFADIAPCCHARPESLESLVHILLDLGSAGENLLDDLIFHPQMPDDILLELAHKGHCVTALAHRNGPRSLLEYIAKIYQESEAITTLALDYYALDSDEVFRAFITKYRSDYMLRWNLRRSQKLPAAKRDIACAIFDKE